MNMMERAKASLRNCLSLPECDDGAGSAPRLLLVANSVLNVALMLLPHHPPPFRKSRVRSPLTRLHTEATTQIDFAAFAERISANWLFPARPQPFPCTSEGGKSARP
jgi:hypothetical protein